MFKYIHLINWTSILSEWIDKLKFISALLPCLCLCLFDRIDIEGLIIIASNEAILLAMLKPNDLPRNLSFLLKGVEIFTNQSIVF